MGDFGPRFLAALAGQASSIGGPTSPVGAVPPENGMSEAVMGFPSVARGGINEAGAVPGQGALPRVSSGGQDAEVEAVVRGFKPKRISFWGALGDQLLKHWGNKPAFEERINNINMQRAMEGFTNDPIEAIRRIGQIPGMQGKAWELLDKSIDNKRQQDQFDRVYGNDQDRALKGAAGLAAIALNRPESRAAAIDRYNQIMISKGMPDYVLPDDVDDATLIAIAGGVTPPSKQEQLQLQRRNLERQERNTNSQIQRRSDQTRQGDIRLNQGQQRINIERANPGGRGKGAAKPDYAGRTMRIKDSKGKERIVEFSKDGKTAYSPTDDGRMIKYNVHNGKLTRVDIQ